MATRKYFTKEFKLEAVGLLGHSGKSGIELARKLDIRRKCDDGSGADLDRVGRSAAGEGVTGETYVDGEVIERVRDARTKT